jgi:hypothetical protein
VEKLLKSVRFLQFSVRAAKGDNRVGRVMGHQSSINTGGSGKPEHFETGLGDCCGKLSMFNKLTRETEFWKRGMKIACRTLLAENIDKLRIYLVKFIYII